jgi:tetratricopeptide (TPR) repeat protein
MLAACSSIEPVVNRQAELPEKVLLDVPLYPQEAYHCGPAALAGLFDFNGRVISPDEIAGWVYIPDRKGSLQIEMQAAVRRAGFLAFLLEPSIETLLQEVAAGNPVLVLQNLGLSWWPKWHYANVIGYDLVRQTIILNSGRTADYEIPLGTFNRTWQRADSWGLVALPADRLPQTAAPQTYTRAAVDLESAGQTELAYLAYSTALNRWPGNPVALMGLGNIRYAQDDHCGAAEVFAELVGWQPDNALGWNNLAYAYRACGCPQEAIASVTRATELAPDDERIAASYRELGQLAAAKQSQPNCLVVPVVP